MPEDLDASYALLVDSLSDGFSALSDQDGKRG
jgi:hypothetical protein